MLDSVGTRHVLYFFTVNSVQKNVLGSWYLIGQFLVHCEYHNLFSTELLALKSKITNNSAVIIQYEKTFSSLEYEICMM